MNGRSGRRFINRVRSGQTVFVLEDRYTRGYPATGAGLDDTNGVNNRVVGTRLPYTSTEPGYTPLAHLPVTEPRLLYIKAGSML